uniref:Putative ovule protein n=1 Tax=Solanum chacoense TaxID=4108 RepID=A0A0V0H4S1_SOLCH
MQITTTTTYPVKSTKWREGRVYAELITTLWRNRGCFLKTLGSIFFFEGFGRKGRNKEWLDEQGKLQLLRILSCLSMFHSLVIPTTNELRNEYQLIRDL